MKFSLVKLIVRHVMYMYVEHVQSNRHSFSTIMQVYTTYVCTILNDMYVRRWLSFNLIS